MGCSPSHAKDSQKPTKLTQIARIHAIQQSTDANDLQDLEIKTMLQSRKYSQQNQFKIQLQQIEKVIPFEDITQRTKSTGTPSTNINSLDNSISTRWERSQLSNSTQKNLSFKDYCRTPKNQLNNQKNGMFIDKLNKSQSQSQQIKENSQLQKIKQKSPQSDEQQKEKNQHKKQFIENPEKFSKYIINVLQDLSQQQQEYKVTERYLHLRKKCRIQREEKENPAPFIKQFLSESKIISRRKNFADRLKKELDIKL